MSEPKIIIPKGKKYVVNNKLDPRKIIAPSGEKLYVHFPNGAGLRSAWIVLQDYTRNVATNPEKELQDLDDVNGIIINYHLNKQSGYMAFTVIDKNQAPVAIATTEIVPATDNIRNHKLGGRCFGFIYQIGVSGEENISNGYTDFSIIPQLYNHLATLLPEISGCGSNKWLGIVTESRKKGLELDAIVNADFDVLVPNEFYRPPATQQDKIQDENNLVTDDLVLMVKGDMKKNNDTDLQRIAARLYLESAYPQGQNLESALSLVNNYFARRLMPINIT